MYRYYDWECHGCKRISPQLVDVPHGEFPPKQETYACAQCGGNMIHDRLMSAPAEYMGEKVHNPQVSGGRFDTMGNRKLPKLPDLPGAAEQRAKIQKEVGNLGPDASKADMNAAMEHHSNNSPTMADYAEHFKTPEYKDAKRRRIEARKENVQKKKRAKALRRGENINMRRDKCVGDPQI